MSIRSLTNWNGMGFRSAFIARKEEFTRKYYPSKNADFLARDVNRDVGEVAQSVLFFSVIDPNLITLTNLWTVLNSPFTTSCIAATAVFLSLRTRKQIKDTNEIIEKQSVQLRRQIDDTLGLVSAFHPSNKTHIGEFLKEAKHEIVILSATAHSVYEQHKQTIENLLHNGIKVYFFLVSSRDETRIFRETWEKAHTGSDFAGRKRQMLAWVTELKQNYGDNFEVKFYYSNLSNYTAILIDGDIKKENKHSQNGKILLNFTGWRGKPDHGIQVTLENIKSMPSNSFNSHAKNMRERWNDDTVTLEKEKKLFEEFQKKIGKTEDGKE